MLVFPSPEELWNLTFEKQKAWRDKFADVPYVNPSGKFPPRYYQGLAVERVLEALPSVGILLFCPILANRQRS